jgi:hypothetical protein
MVLAARPTLAQVPLADLSFKLAELVERVCAVIRSGGAA